ncbi:right-handed parallel beta-helix repeat-containing protein [Falsiroseomonas tokyonensis]|uniref:Right-handed parallel beta-helix repeat-containing protein n=1 Tax=Falsiroseomonas tokyonensis TaxID=430521 RepID=A0ABV7C143_9PROT|nr:right-handed parallel beta-helix repeat-containing protein [Falsiroseomonas tokyonensis]MBU8540180.1 right-handed parallel beta-helix repeat-containing protein [Falsiroseomonas tokyonensis]
MAYQRIGDFDLWRAGYGGAVVEVFQAGTTTLASLFSDPALTLPVANPQTLASRSETDGTSYGRFAQPVYVGVPYQLRINQGEQTAVEQLPLTSLVGANASAATAAATRGGVSRTLAQHFDVEVRTENFGTFGTSAAANQSILDAAIGAAAAQGGGSVLLPPGDLPFLSWTLPQGVVLVGRGRDSTVLRSDQTTAVCTIGGDRAGLRDLKLDGVNANTGSFGVLSIGQNDLILDNVAIDRFATGIAMRGGDRARFIRLHVFLCAVGVDIRGDRDALLSNTGGPIFDLLWDQGVISSCTSEGIRLSFEDDPVNRVEIRGVQFRLNSTGVFVNGARDVLLHRCVFFDNDIHLAVQDDSDLSREDENTVQQLTVQHSRVDDGQLTFNGLCEDVRFERTEFVNASFVLSVPTFPILLVDCTEDADTTSTGAIARLMRDSSFKRGEFPGVTTDNAYTTAWSRELEPGEVIRVRSRILGRQRDGGNWGSGEVVATYSRPGSALPYDLASATPVVGTIVTGNTSGAVARVAGVTGATSGTLSLRDIAGAFINGEGLTFSDAKTATATSTLTPQAVDLRDATTLNYDSASVTPATFTFVFGVTSGASALMVSTTGTTAGTMTLVNLDKLFIDNENLVFSNGTTAVADGNVLAADWYVIPPENKTDLAWGWRAAVAGSSALIQVRGNTSQIVEWVVETDVMRP